MRTIEPPPPRDPAEGVEHSHGRLEVKHTALVLPETPYDAALEVARKRRGAISQTALKVERQNIRVTDNAS
jgi:hypothetical protein